MKWILSLTSCLLFLQTLNTQAETFKVLAYNTWGVPIAAWDTWRYPKAMKAIEEMNPDLVLLSEVFTAKAKLKFNSKTYPYQADGGRFFPRLVGSGLRILSKFPFKRHAILTYGSCKKDDCLSRKGAALIVVTLPSGKKLNVVATHLNAAGGEKTRISQLKQLEIFSDWYEDKSAPTLIAGDFNFGPQSNEYAFARTHLQIDDAWEKTHTSDEPGYTYDCYDNHYARDYSIKTNSSLFKGRIDYLFYRGLIRPLGTRLEFNTESSLFSDHYGVWGEFEI